MKKYVATDVWEAMYPNPITLQRGDTVELSNEKVEENPEWQGWQWCKEGGTAGWVPVQIIQKLDENRGLILQDFTAKELSVNKGDTVLSLKELNAWAWCKKENEEEQGWLPLNILKEITTL